MFRKEKKNNGAIRDVSTWYTPCLSKYKSYLIIGTKIIKKLTFKIILYLESKGM